MTIENGMENGWNYNICKNEINHVLKIRGPQSKEVRGKDVQFLMCLKKKKIIQYTFFFFTHRKVYCACGVGNHLTFAQDIILEQTY